MGPQSYTVCQQLGIVVIVPIQPIIPIHSSRRHNTRIIYVQPGYPSPRTHRRTGIISQNRLLSQMTQIIQRRNRTNNPSRSCFQVLNWDQTRLIVLIS
jgi:hypothetical protein